MRAVVLALTLALVASHQINLVPEFAAGKTFVYKYEGLLLGGLPQEGLAKAGVKVSSKVHISAVAQNTFLMKLLNPQLFEYTGIWPQDAFKPATKLTSALNAQLVIPIKYEYANGVVGKIFAPARVSATVLNLHRGILNILQLNLKNTQNVYELHEAGTQGVCKTHYMISEDVKTHQITVRKSKDLTNCHERVMKDIGLAYTETCDECQQRLKSLSGTATFRYIMKPTDTGALVSEATVEEVHQFSLLNTQTGAAQMRTKQMLTLQEVQNAPIAPHSGEYLSRGSLRYEFATEILQTPIQLLKINNAQAQIVEVLQHLVTNNMVMAHEDAPLKFVQLVQLMRVATLENIEAIWAQYKTKPLHRRWILDALPVVGTTVALRFIKEKFQADEFAVHEFTQTLLVALHMATANQDAIHLTANLASNPKVKKNPVLRKVIMLGYGSMIAKYCAEVPTCPADLLKPIHESAAEAISKGDHRELTLALKVMGNAGHPASLKTIMKLLPGFGNAAAAVSLRVQIDAILALRNIAKKEPKMVQPVALQLFMDKALHPELRMVACIVLFETKPSVALMATLGGALEKETNMHVVSFVYSHIKSLTRSMAPDYMHVAAAANVAFRMLSPKLDRLSHHFSRAIHYDLYISPFMVGAAGSAYLINDAATTLPRAVVTRARAYLAGAAADVLEVGVRTEGLHEALQKSHAVNENADRITNIKRTIKALRDWKSMPENQQLASIYVKVFGQEIAFANIDKAFIDKMIIEQATQLATGPQGRELLKEAVKALQKGIAFQYAKPLLAAEVRRILPSSLGVPMELGYYTAAVATAALNVQGTITPSLPEDPETLSLDQLMKTDFQLQAEARPSVALQTFAVIGVNTALIQAAVMARGKIQTVIPSKVDIRADLPKGNVKLEVLPAAVPDQIAAVSFETVAVSRNTEDLPNERVMSLAPPASSDAAQWLIPASFQKTLCGVCPYIQIKGCVEIASQNAGFMASNPLYYIIGQHSAKISVARGDGPALERLELEVQVGPKAAEKLMKEISLVDVENPEESTILLKLREILEGGQRNSSSSSKSSSSSGSSSKSVSNSRSSSSSRSSRNSRRTSSSRSSKSSSMSSSSARVSKNTNAYHQFQKFHKDRYITSQGTSKASSSSSIETLQRKSKILGDEFPPFFAIIARVVRADRKLGYQIAAYLDKPTSRVQVVFASISEHDKWKICADAILPSKHKFAAKLAIGEQCQGYSVAFKAETGLHETHPAARLEWDWNRAPSVDIPYVKRAREFIFNVAPLAGINADRADNKERQINVILALPTQKSLNIIFRIPKMTLSKQDVPLPIALPIEQDGSIPGLQNFDIQAIVEEWLNNNREN
ncbi:vitellogenin-like [Hemibagrus wyckioides]|uniref:vitellogenin-like n=1 Tax=Hemibagrus wyckioides TaxID=337641 RepID=UPI00266D643F|nr:vitellogenin-like [Hemibagrus wyckioides]